MNRLVSGFLFLILVLILVLGLLVSYFDLSHSQGSLEPVLYNDPEYCVNELDALRSVNLANQDVNIISGSCITCSPWYVPQVGEFWATLEESGKQYYVYYKSNCPRHAQPTGIRCVISDTHDQYFTNLSLSLCAHRDKSLCSKYYDNEGNFAHKYFLGGPEKGPVKVSTSQCFSAQEQ